MTRIVYLNGAYVPENEAKVSIFDRGLQFADSVYEVWGVLDGRIIDWDNHIARLKRSLGELRIPPPMSDDEIQAMVRELAKRAGLELGLVYLQVTRGVAERDFVIDETLAPTVFAFAQHKAASETALLETGATMASVEDLRWARRDIKSTGLLAQSLAKTEAKRAGAYEALLVKDGFVTEGGATSFYFIKGETIVTRPLSRDILPGCTRISVLRLAREHDLSVEERVFTLDEAKAADGAFLTGASTFVLPIIRIDDATLGDGRPHPLTRRLLDIYLQEARARAV